jgi:hypothetical protein
MRSSARNDDALKQQLEVLTDCQLVQKKFSLARMDYHETRIVDTQ